MPMVQIWKNREVIKMKISVISQRQSLFNILTHLLLCLLCMYNFVLYSLDHIDIKLYPDFSLNITQKYFPMPIMLDTLPDSSFSIL